MPIPYTKPAPPSDDKRWKIVATRMRRLGDRPEALIEALHSAQEAFGFLDDDALRFVGDTLGVPHSRVFGVATFYSFFTLKPQGQHTCVVLHRHGLLHQRRRRTSWPPSASGSGIKPRQTTADDRVSLLTARCIGACSLAPAVMVDGEMQGKCEPAKLMAALEAM